MSSGLGKSLQIISLARYKRLHNNLKHCLIICGVNSLKWNWVNEVNKFCTEEKAIVLGTGLNTRGKVKSLTIEETKGQIDTCPEEFFWIINIERIRLNKEDSKTSSGIVHHINKQIESGNLGMVVVDEIHMSKDASSQTGKGLLAITPSVSKVGMTGTLLVNNPYDLYFPMTFTGLINYNKFGFEKKFVIKNDWGQPIGYQNMNELHELLYKSSIRRTKDLLDLPEKMYKQEFLEFSKEEQAVFDAVIGRGNEALLDKIPPIFEMIATITRMRQASVACSLLSSHTKKSTKLDRLNDILAEARMNGQKVLVFCPFTEALKLGLDYCKEFSPKLVAGGMGDNIKKVVDEHENTDGFSVLFAQEATLGVGYTLTNTEIVVFLSPPWNEARYVQCQDRCFAKNTIVMTTNGPKYIQHITTDDFVYTPYGNIKRVIATHIIRNSKKQMANVHIKGLTSNFPIKCTADHKVLGIDGIWREIKMYKPGDYVYAIPEISADDGIEFSYDLSTYIENSYRSFNSQGVVKQATGSHFYKNHIDVDEEFMFLLGMYYGDGYVHKEYKFLAICGNRTTKYEALCRIQNYIASISDATCSMQFAPEDTGAELRIFSQPLAKFFANNFGRIGKDKYIPKQVFDFKKDYLKSLLEGLLRSDGYTRERNNSNRTINYQYVTTTPSLATGVWFLISRLGFKPSFETKFKYGSSLLREYCISFNYIRNQAPRGDRDYKIGRISDIKLYSVNNMPNGVTLYDISVEDDECYMVGNLPVHNCHRIGQHNTVQIIDLLIKDTFDELIYKKLHGKGAMSSAIVDGAEIDALQEYFKDMNIIFK